MGGKGSGRRPQATTKVIWELPIDRDVANMVEILLFNPLTAKPFHGERGKLVTQLLREWIRKQQHQEQQP